MWTKGAAPPEWLMYVICSRFHVLPSQVAAEPYGNMMALLTCMEMEQRVETLRVKPPARFGRG